MPKVTNAQDEEFAEAESLILESIRNAERIRFEFDGNLSTWHVVNKAFSSLHDTSKIRTFARHLVGAILQLRFLEIDVSVESSRSFDVLANVTENFLIGDTAIYVTDFATFDAFYKFSRDILDGRRVFLLVPENRLASGRSNAELVCSNQMAVESIESFVSQNIEQISMFCKDSLVLCMRELVDLYNERINKVEGDTSLRIELLSNL